MSAVTQAPPVQAPERSLQQRMDALQRANEIRIRRAELKRELKARTASPADHVAEPPDWLATAKVFDLMIAIPKVGRVKAGKILTRHTISPSKTVGGLSDRQRRELLRELKPYSRTIARSHVR